MWADLAVHQNLFKTFSQGTVQDHALVSDSMLLESPEDLPTGSCSKTLAKSFMPGPLTSSAADLSAVPEVHSFIALSTVQ